MAYTHISFAALRTELANRLDDPSKVYWVDAELKLYILESLRVWQSLANYWRDRMTFNTAAPVVPANGFVDLTTQTNSLLSFNVKDSDLVSLILYHLIEPQLSGSPGTYVGSDQFILADFTKALERRRNQFLAETGMVLSRSLMNWPSPTIERAALVDSVIDVRRIAWIDVTNVFTHLWRSDEWAAGAFKVGWVQTPSAPPSVYSLAVVPPVTVELISPPADVGQIELLTLSTGATLDPTTGVLLGIPDNFSWVVKYGALADMLSKEGQAKDTLRAEYCERRWQEGINIARSHTSVEQGYLDGKQVFVEPISSLDCYKVGWQNQTPTTPTMIGIASWNLLALSPPPDSGSHSVLVDVLRNAPLPSLDTDNVQVGREELDAILDYSQHIASFKMGGQEFAQTVPLYERMVRLASVRNERLKASIPFLEPLADRAMKEEEERPRRTKIEAIA